MTKTVFLQTGASDRAADRDPGYSAERITGPIEGGRINMIRGIRRRKPLQASPVLYVHGATFAASLAIGWRFDGRSWMDHLIDAGFDVWGFDFLGFGASDRYAGMAEPAAAGKALGRTPQAGAQLAAVVRHVLDATGARKLHLLAHSWGTHPACAFAGDMPELVDRLALFGPILERQPGNARLPDPERLPAYSFITVEDQWKRFTEDVPAGHPPVLPERHFRPWSEAYLDTDANSRGRTPPSVQTPLGPAADIAAAWQGRLPYDPAAVRAPVLLVRGEWDSLCNDEDAAWFMHSFNSAAAKRDIRIPKGTHLMHLEKTRIDLWNAVRDFLAGAA